MYDEAVLTIFFCSLEILVSFLDTLTDNFSVKLDVSYIRMNLEV